MIAAKRQRPILKHIPPLGVWVPPLVVGDPPLGGRGATPKIGFRRLLHNSFKEDFKTGALFLFCVCAEIGTFEQPTFTP